MDMIFVKPAAGGRVRQPERQCRVMPEDGAFVPRDAHYERLLSGGDVVMADAPGTAIEKPADPETKTATSTGRPRAARAPEE